MAYEIINELDQLNGMVKGRSTELEQSLTQLEEYQIQMQQLRQKIIQEEQHLRVVLAPTYLPHDRDTAMAEQQVSQFDSFVVRTCDYIHSQFIQFDISTSIRLIL